MSINIEYRKGIYGREIEINESKWRADSFGVVNTPRRGAFDFETIEELEQDAEQINYDSNLSNTEKLLSRVYGGEIETVHGNVEWTGKMPDDVEQYVEKVERSISGKTRGEKARQVGRGIISELI